MGGSGGPGFPTFGRRVDIRQWLDESLDAAATAEHNSRVNGALGELLAQYNGRDVELMRDRLNEVMETLTDSLDESFDLRFGGSIAKHTYIDGLSDVDALIILRDSELASGTAGETLNQFADTLHRELGYTVNVHEGQLAVTVSYPDGMDIQLLPAIKTDDGLRISAGDGQNWSPVIRPDAFASKLTERNQECNNRLVPVIKLAKAALARLDDSLKPTGYHVESLAVEAFKGYSGASNHKVMLRHFFEQASELVLAPIKDSTNQSVHVDDNLGEADSRQRRSLSAAMDRITRRLSNADSAGSSDDWMRAIGEGL